MWARENDFDALVNTSAMRNGIDPLLLKAFIGQESKFTPTAVRFEPKINDASYGLTQILSKTAKDRGYRGTTDGLYDPATNIEYGARHIAHVLALAPDLPSAISRYNGGYNPSCAFGVRATKPGRCCVLRDKQGNCIRWSTFKVGEFGNQSYVNSVLANYAYFQSKQPPPTPATPATPAAPPAPSLPSRLRLSTGVKVSTGAGGVLLAALLAWLIFGRK